MTWRDISPDPTAPEVLAERRRVLDAAYRVEHRDRLTLIRDLCRGKRVVDVGCVDHQEEQTRLPTWLHGQLREVAAEVVGVDFEAAGVKAMQRQGFDVIEADISGDISAVTARGPFDVVVAGDIIEHLDTPVDLFHFARKVLRDGGELVVTTPNAYSPTRHRRAATRETWENADHVAYFMPTGIAELAERAGMRLTVATTVHEPPARRMLLRSLRRRVNGQWRDDPHWTSVLDVLVYRLRGRYGLLGETAIYVVRA